MGQIVISYPASLDDPALSGRKTFTFELNNQVSPNVRVQLAKDSAGHFSYDYTPRNDESTRQSIQSWSLVGPLDDPGFSASRISQLVTTGALRSDSPFVNAALAALKRSIEAGGTPSVGEIAAQLPTPSAGLEADIAAAMKTQ